MRRALAAAALLVLAGCGGTPSAGDTLTPAPIPQAGDDAGAPAATGPGDEPTAAAADHLGTGGPDPFELADAHADALANRSFTVVRTLVVRDRNGTLRSVNLTARVAAGGVPYRFARTSWSAPGYPVSSVPRRVAVWYDGRATVYRVPTGNGSYRTHRDDGLGGPLDDLDAEHRLASLYAGFERWNATCRQRACQLTATDLQGSAAADLPILVGDPTNATLRVRVSPDGRVERLRLRYDARFDGRPVTVVRTMRFLAVGETVVRRPAWAEAGANRTSPAPGEGSKMPL